MKILFPLVCSLLAAPLLSHATNDTFKAGFNNVQMQVIDLTPDDEQTASVSFASDYRSNYIQAILGDNLYWNIAMPQGVGEIHYQDPALGRRLDVDFSQSRGQIELHAPGDDGPAVIAGASREFTLAPYSALRMTGHSSIFNGRPHLPRHTPGYAYMFSSVYLISGSKLAHFLNDSDAHPRSNEEDFDLVLRNDSAFPMTGNYNLYLLAYANPVPEAETWAMLGAGLLGLGAIARRRKQAQ